MKLLLFLWIASSVDFCNFQRIYIIHREQIKKWTLSFRMKGKLNFETFDLFESSHNSCCELKMKLSSNIGRKKHSEVLPLKDILLDWNNFKIGH